MPATIKIKNSSTASAVPTSSDLVQGELAVNVTDKRIFTENASGTVVELGTNPSILTLPDGSASAPTLTNDGDTNTGIFFPAADTVGITTGGTERARVDSSGNLGVGVTSPSGKLHVSGQTRIADSSSASNYILIGSGANAPRGGNALTAQTGSLVFATETANPMIFVTNATEAARIDSSGNLGLGVTPSATSVANVMMQMKGGAVYSSNSTNMKVLGNAFFNGTNFIYQSNGFASQYSQGDGVGAHSWHTAASGTAGNAITFTQAMTLDASGNLLVGGTSNSGALKILATDGTVQVGLLPFAAGSIAYAGTWTNHAFGFATNGTEKVRIDSSGNLGVGTTSPDSGARVTVQAASGANGMAVKAGTNGNYGIYFNNTSNSTVGGIIINSGSVAYNTTSDYRLKENIQPMTGALEKVAQLKPCTYTWKADGSASQGFIAHELQAVVPDCVTGEKDAVNEDGSIKPQGIDTSFLVATLTAAIQELKAEFDAYKASHP